MFVSTPLRLALLAVLLILYLAEWRNSDPRPNDFAAFYSGAILWENNQQPFNRPLQCEIQARIGVPICLPFFHPPVLLPLLSLVSNGNYSASYFRWVAMLLIVVVVCAIPIRRLTNADYLDVALYLSFFPIFVLLFQGQDTAFVLLGVLMCAYFLKIGRDGLAGIALALAVLRPHLAIAISLPLLFSRRKAFASFVATALILLLFSLALVGIEGFQQVFRTISVTAKGADPTIRQAEMYNLTAILVRSGLSPFWGWPFFLLSIVGVSILWRKRTVTQSTFALGVLCAVFTSPHLHAHDLSLLILPMLFWTSAMTALISIGFVAAIVFGFQHLFAYALMLTLGLSFATDWGVFHQIRSTHFVQAKTKQ